MDLLKIGRRKMDCLIMLDWHQTRGIVVTDVNLVEGVCLEPQAFRDNKYGAVLIHRDWKRMYFLAERHEWTYDDYFNHAEKRFKELEIDEP